MTTPVPVDARTLDWPRKVANAVNYSLKVLAQRQTVPFQKLDADPTSPVASQTYYNLTTNKVRVFDGTAWHDLF